MHPTGYDIFRDNNVSTPTETVPSPLNPRMESRAGLLRVLGPGMAIAVVVGNVIGSGIFFKPGAIAADAGEFPLIISAWVFGGFLCVLGALSFAELAAMLPRAGGPYVYLREAYGRPAAFLFGFNEFLFSRPAAIGALSVAFTDSLAAALRWEMPVTVKVLFAISVIAVVAWINVVGVIWGGRLQGLTTLLKGGFLFLIGIAPFVFSMGGAGGVTAANYATTVVPEQLAWSVRFGAVLLAVMWAYDGWHGISPIAEEIREPHKNIPRALILGVGILTVLYVLANVAYHGVLTMDEVKAAGTKVAPTMVGKLLTPWGANAAHLGVASIGAVIMCSTFSGINSNLLLAPRIVFAMGRDGVFFRSLGRVHVNYRTPAAAIVIQAGMAMGLVIGTAVMINFGESLGRIPLVAQLTGGQPFVQMTIFDTLTNFVVFSASIFYMLSVLAVFVLRWKHPDWERPYRTRGYPFVPAAFVLFYCWFLAQIYLAKPFESQLGLAMIVLGLPVYFAYGAWAKRHPEDAGDGQ